jgi:hypothetical protein
VLFSLSSRQYFIALLANFDVSSKVLHDLLVFYQVQRQYFLLSSTTISEVQRQYFIHLLVNFDVSSEVRFSFSNDCHFFQYSKLQITVCFGNGAFSSIW